VHKSAQVPKNYLYKQRELFENELIPYQLLKESKEKLNVLEKELEEAKGYHFLGHRVGHYLTDGRSNLIKMSNFVPNNSFNCSRLKTTYLIDK